MRITFTKLGLVLGVALAGCYDAHAAPTLLNANNIATAAPSGTGLGVRLDLNAPAGNIGTALTLLRSDAVFGVSGILPGARGGLGIAQPICTTGQVITCDGGFCSCSSKDMSNGVFGTLAQARGGTGAGALTCTAGQYLTSNGTVYSCSAANYVSLQATTPGTADTGNLNVSGTAIASVVESLNGARVGTMTETANSTLSFSTPGSGSGTYSFNSSSTRAGTDDMFSFNNNGSLTFSGNANGRLLIGSGVNGGIRGWGGGLQDIWIQHGGNPVLTLDTLGINQTTGNLFKVNNNAVLKFGVDFNGKINVPVGGAADTAGRVALVAGTKTVSTTAVTASSVIMLTNCIGGGTIGLPQVGTVTAATSFVINSVQPGTASTLQNADTSTICWHVLN